jgi:transcriptional regulator with XRE-family HTH domain
MKTNKIFDCLSEKEIKAGKLKGIIAAAIENARFASGLSLDKFAKKSDISPKLISKAEDVESNLTIDELVEVLEKLNIDYSFSIDEKIISKSTSLEDDSFRKLLALAMQNNLSVATKTYSNIDDKTCFNVFLLWEDDDANEHYAWFKDGLDDCCGSGYSIDEASKNLLHLIKNKTIIFNPLGIKNNRKEITFKEGDI